MRTSLQSMAIGCVAVTLLISAPQAMAMDKALANDASAGMFANKHAEHANQQRVGIEEMKPVFWLQPQAASEPRDGVKLAQESRMSRLHRQWGRYGQSRGTYFENGGPSYYYGNAYYQNGVLFYAQGYNNAYARDSGFVNDWHAAPARTMKSGRVILRHEQGGFPGCCAENDR